MLKMKNKKGIQNKTVVLIILILIVASIVCLGLGAVLKSFGIL